MERRIEIKRQEAKSLNPYELVERLSKVFGLRESDSVRYEEGKYPQSGTLILRGEKDYDIQQVGYLISDAGYTVIRGNLEAKPAGNTLEKITGTLGNLRERARQLGNSTVRRLRETKGLYNLIEGGQR